MSVDVKDKKFYATSVCQRCGNIHFEEVNKDIIQKYDGTLQQYRHLFIPNSWRLVNGFTICENCYKEYDKVFQNFLGEVQA